MITGLGRPVHPCRTKEDQDASHSSSRRRGAGPGGHHRRRGLRLRLLRRRRRALLVRDVGGVRGRGLPGRSTPAATCGCWPRRAAGTLDPQINYTLQYWQLYQSTYDGLVAFKQAGGGRGHQDRARPRRRAPDADRRRQDLHLQAAQGDQVLRRPATSTGDDVVATFQRMFKVSSPTAGSTTASSARTRAQDAGDLHSRRASSADDAAGTVTFNLTAPDPEFLDKLALPLAFVVPADTPDQGRRQRAPPGTGPTCCSVQPEQGDVLVRNPHFKEWSADAQPDGLSRTRSSRSSA